MVEPRVASGECGGGLGAVAPAVGDDGPQHEVGTAAAGTVAVLLVAVNGESPTTSISSSSSTSMAGSSARSGHG